MRPRPTALAFAATALVASEAWAGERAPLVWVGAPLVADALWLLAALVGIVALLWWLARRERPVAAAENAEPLQIRAFGWAGAAVGGALVGLQAYRFRFAFDDFAMLTHVREGRLAAAGGLRYLSNGVRVLVAEALGGRWAYAAFNLLAVVGMFVAWRAFLRHGGMSKSRATAAAALGVATAPGLFLMQLQATGFEQVGTMALVLGALASFDAAARCPSELPRRQLALTATGVLFTVTGVFSKLPTASLAPVALCAALLVVERPVPLLRRAVIGFTACAAWVLPVWLFASDASAELMKAGGGRRVQVLQDAWHEELRLASALGLVLAVAVGVGLAARILPFARTPVTLPRARFVVRMLLVASAVTAPFLLNSLYWTPYYLLMASLPLSALVFEFSASLLPAAHVGALAAALVALCPVPVDTVGTLLDGDDPSNGIEPILREVARQAQVLNPTGDDHVIFTWTPKCAAPFDQRRSEEELPTLSAHGARGDGLRWATGWKHVRVEYPGLSGTNTNVESEQPDDGRPYLRLQVAYCSRHPPVVTLGP